MVRNFEILHWIEFDTVFLRLFYYTSIIPYSLFSGWNSSIASHPLMELIHVYIQLHFILLWISIFYITIIHIFFYSIDLSYIYNYCIICCFTFFYNLVGNCSSERKGVFNVHSNVI